MLSDWGYGLQDFGSFPDDDAPAPIPMRLTGRCRNGAERDGGHVVHAVTGGMWGNSLCGARPGLRSNGWSEYVITGPGVTCRKCLKRLAEGR